MNTKTVFLRLMPAVLALLSTSCLVKETVTVNGEVREDDYKIKHPLEDVIEDSQ